MKITDIFVSGLKGAAIGFLVALAICFVMFTHDLGQSFSTSNIALMIAFITMIPALVMMWFKYIKIQTDIEEEKRRTEKNKQRQLEREQLDNHLKLQQRIKHELDSELRFDKSRLVNIPTITPSYQTVYYQKKEWESIVTYYEECAKLINRINGLTNEDIYND